MHKVLTIIVFYIFFFDTFAQWRKNKEYKAVRMNVSAFAGGPRLYRGALIWDSYMLGSFPNFTFFDFINVGRGGALNVFKTFANYHMLSLGISSFDDNEPNGPVILITDREEDFKNQRGATWGSFFTYTFRYQRILSLSIKHAFDHKRFKGHYVMTSIATSLFSIINFSLGASVGDTLSNRYAYGPTAESGIGHLEFRTGLFLPILPWKGIVIPTAIFSTIPKRVNYDADYVRGNKNNFQTMLVLSWNVL